MMLRSITTSFKQRIIIGFSALFLLFLSVMIAVEMFGIPGTRNRGTFAMSRSKTLSDMELVSGLLSQRILFWFNERRIDVDGFTSSLFLRKAIENQTPDQKNELILEIKAFLTSHPAFCSIYIFDKKGSGIASVGHVSGVRNADDIGITKEVYSGLVIPGYFETIILNSQSDGTTHLRIIRQIFSSKNPDTISAILVAESEIKKAMLPLIVSTSDILPRDWQCLLADNSRGVITLFHENSHSEKSPPENIPGITEFAPVRLAVSGIDGPYDGPDQEGDPVLAYHRQIRINTGIALALVLKMDRSLSMRQARTELFHQGIFWFFVLITGIGFCIVIANQVSSPINELVGVARRIEAGDLSARAFMTDSSEIGQLSMVFNRMIDRIQTWNQELEKRVQEKTRDLQNLTVRQDAILTAVPDIIMEVDRHKIYTWSNQAGFDFFGDDVLGKDVAVYFSGDQNTYEVVQPLFDGTKRVINVESWQKRRDGEIRLLSWRCKSLEDEKGRVAGVLATARDITELKRSEKEKRELHDQLIQMQKMESVGRLAGGVAHDFNNMLGVILGHTEMALEEVDSGSSAYEDLQEIQKAAKRSADLTRQLLAFARKQTVAPKVLDLNDTITSMLKMLQRLIGEDIHLTWQPCAKPWSVKMDPSQIDQILANLCVNARDAIDGIGTISIITENIVITEDYCSSHPSFIPGDYVQIILKDNGCGIDKDALTQIFEPFFTTKKIGEGTGLGLATVYGAVKQNNGFINVASEPGQGTTFSIFLPRYAEKELEEVKPGIMEPNISGDETILLVEDESSILKMARMILERQGYTVLAANSPEEAVHQARNFKNDIHLIITDVIMPRMNGRDLAKEIMPLHPAIKTLFMSGYTANVIAPQGVLDTGMNFIQKPFSKKDLGVKVREVLDEK